MKMSSVEEWYKCSECGRTGVRLWRDNPPFPKLQLVRCSACISKAGGRKQDDVPYYPVLTADEPRTWLNFASGAEFQQAVEYWRGLPVT